MADAEFEPARASDDCSRGSQAPTEEWPAPTATGGLPARLERPFAEPGSVFVPYADRPLADVLCVQDNRIVGADNCVSRHRRSVQIPQQ
jgi:hypothetical protein